MNERADHPLKDFPLFCGNCVHHKSNADQEAVESTCKRLDHKRIRIRRKSFQAYDCGYMNQCICREFEPVPYYRWLCSVWKGYDDYAPFIDRDEIALEDTMFPDVTFFVSHSDFADGNFLNSDGSIRWRRKQYYRGKRLYTEFPNGTVVRGNCQYNTKKG